MADASASAGGTTAGPASAAPDTVAEAAPPAKAPPPLPAWHYWSPAASAPAPSLSMNDQLVRRLR
eukprot:2227834-Lingulodinium_polyedra.AAC.1